MIVNLLIFVLINIFGAIFSFLPVVTISSIPFVGVSASALLLRMAVMWNAFMVTFPYAVYGWHAFFVILAFELLLLVAKFFLGSRTPAHDNVR